MGVSLERVQNKFACIIGELCNEPVVLSKFAIWLDLRLAEYKAKGAISLDGFGENPDPSWLKGHDKEDFNTMKASLLPQNDTVPSWNLSTVNFPFAGGGQFPETEPLLNESITYQKIENVSVKEEVEENDIEIITQGSEKSGRLKSSEQSYKRLASDTNIGASGEKFKRLSGDGRLPTSQDPTNESLVSIIAKSNDDINTVEDPVHVIPVPNSVTTNFNIHGSDLGDTASRGDNSRALSHFDPFAVGSYTSASSTATITENSRTAQPFQSFSPSGGEVVLAQDQSEILGNRQGQMTTNLDSKSEELSGNTRQSIAIFEGAGLHARQNQWARQRPRVDKHSVRCRIISPEKKSAGVIRNMVNVVMCLERWLCQSANELRFVEEIPPAELDPYLCEFFHDLKKPGGKDYDPLSFKGFPTNLDRFLKDHNYPASIRNSHLFRKSQEVYSKRFRQLKWNKDQEQTLLHVY